MKLYALIGKVAYEGGELVGVFVDRDKALEELEELNKDNCFADWVEVYEVEEGKIYNYDNENRIAERDLK